MDFITSALTWEWVRDVEEEHTTLPLTLLNVLGLFLLLKETIFFFFFPLDSQMVQKSVNHINHTRRGRYAIFFFKPALLCFVLPAESFLLLKLKIM